MTKYRINGPEMGDRQALKKIINLALLFESAAEDVLDMHSVEVPMEVRYSQDNPDYVVGSRMQYSAYQLMHDAALDALVDLRSFDFRLGHLFKAASDSGIGSKIVNAIPAALLSNKNRILFNKYEIQNLALIANMR